MSEMILLQTLVPQREVLVMKEVVRQIVTDVAEDATTVDRRCHVPIPEEKGMSKLPERCRECYEQSRRHDESVLVHGQIMMDAMKQEVESDANTIVGKITIDY